MLALLRPLAASFALAAAPAQGEPKPEAAPEAPAAEPPAAAEKPAAAPEKEDTWIDVGHAFVEQRIFAPILRLDRFFSDERNLDLERSRSFLRWRNELHVTEDVTRPVFTTGLRANLVLPGLNQQLRRLRLVIEGDTREAIQSLFPRAGGVAAGEGDELGTANAGLRFFLWDTLLSHMDLGAGILTRLPPGVYGQIRLRNAVPVGKLFLTRSFVSGFWRTDTLFGTSAGLELERVLTPRWLARLSGNGTLTETSRGVEWSSELAVLVFLDERSAAQVALAVNGVTRPAPVTDDTGAQVIPPEIDRFRFYTRVRRDVYRRWIFVELEPELAWPWTPDRGRHSAWGVSFRVEVQFQGEEAPDAARGRPEPVDPQEPPDPPDVRALPNEPAPR